MISDISATSLVPGSSLAIEPVNEKEKALKKISSCIADIVSKKEILEVTYYNSQENHIVFSLQAAPSLIFKMRKQERVHKNDFSMKERLANIQKARSICKTHNLWLLVVPKAEIVTIEDSHKKYELLVEKKLAIQNYSITTLPFLSEQAAELFRQLAVFILHSGFSDVSERNVPWVKSKKANATQFKMGLIDLEEMNSVYSGLFGNFRRSGLTGLFSSSKTIVIEEIKKVVNIDELNKSFQEKYQLDFSHYPKSKSKLISIANHLYQRCILKKKLQGVLEGQKESKLMVKIDAAPFLGANHVNCDTSMNQLLTEQEVYDSTFIGIVSKEFQKHGLITGVSSRHNDAWFLICS